MTGASSYFSNRRVYKVLAEPDVGFSLETPRFADLASQPHGSLRF